MTSSLVYPAAVSPRTTPQTSPPLYKCINVPMFHVLFIRSGVRAATVARVYMARLRRP